MKRLVLFATLILAVLNARAYDFSATAPSGQTLYFNYAAGGVEVTCPGSTNASGWNAYTRPTGALTLPTTVTHNDTAYSVVGIGRYAFYGCYGLTSVAVGEGVSTLGQAAFSGCTGIDSLSLPSSLTALGITALYNCSSLTAITCAAAMPPTVGNNAFVGINTSACTLRVPCTSTALYAADAAWSNFDIAASGTCSATVTALANDAARGSVSGSGTYAIGTTVSIAATPADGFFFAFWHDGDTLNPRLVTITADTTLTAMFFPSQRDTVVVTLVQHDTVTLHDTVYYPVVHVDTFYIHDTLTLTDTLQLTDTIYPTYFRLTVQGSDGGIGIGSALVPAGTELEIGALPIEGYRFEQWSDGTTDNPRRVTVSANATLTATFAVITGIDAVDAPSWTAVADGRSIVVDGCVGQTVSLFDVQGRQLFQRRAEGGRLVLQVQQGGIYLVAVGGSAARKVAVR